MDVKIVIAIIIAIIISIQPAGIPFPIIVQDIPNDGNGYTVVAQTQFYNNGKVACIIINPAFVDAPNINAVIVHEFGHVNHPEWDEAQCDDWANSIVDGPDVIDAYHGIH